MQNPSRRSNFFNVFIVLPCCTYYLFLFYRYVRKEMTESSSTPSIATLVKTLDLIPHPEGGYFKQWYASELILSSDLDSSKWEKGSTRSTSTAIWYLCPGGGKSSLHAIKSDELWFWHGGSPLIVVELCGSSGSTANTPTISSSSPIPIPPYVKQTLLGPLGLPGSQCTHMVKGGTYFGAYCPTETELLQYYAQTSLPEKSSSSSTLFSSPPGSDVYALVSCVVAPGFDYRDWEMKTADELRTLYPGKDAEYFINKLAKDV